MTPERWREVEDLLQAALERTPGQRAVFLESACGADAALRNEVESLLDSERHVRGFLESSALEDSASLLVDDPPNLAPGSRLGPYVIEEHLGSGGMGDVFLAHDVRLGRKVALKLLETGLTADEASRARFLREARLASALDHPGICTVYEVAEAGDLLYISMQFIDGRTLRRTIDGRPLALHTLLALGLQVGEALAAAHAHGVIHRDVKCCNIMVTRHGRAKVLDFGLAILGAHDEESSGDGAPHTRIVMGTPASMSPEQARGERVDHRTDIFAFGVVLYEMATGRRPFDGPSRADVIEAVLQSPHTPAGQLNPALPARLSRLIDRALAKSTSDRYQTMSELVEELRGIAAEAGTGPPSSRTETAALDRANEEAGISGRRRWFRPGRSRTSAANLMLAALMTAALVVPLGVLMTRPGGRAPAAGTEGAKVQSIAVLPFKPLLPGHRNEVLEMGMADTLIAKLSAIDEIDVRPINAVRKYGGIDQDALAAGLEQRVDAVIDGQIQKADGRVRVTVRLLRVRGGKQIWAGQFDEPLTDIFSLQDAISGRVSSALALTLSGQEQRLLTKRHTGDVEAYQLYLLGRYHLTRLTDEGFARGLDYFNRAIARDASYALAYAGLSEAYLNLSSFNALPSREGFPRAREAAEAALRLDEGLAEAHAALAGAIFLHDWKWAAAEDQYRRALELNPGASDAHMAYGFFLATMGRTEWALRAAERSLELDPLSPAKVTGVGDVLYMARRFDEAQAQYRRALEMDPNLGYGFWALGRALAATADYGEAEAALLKAIPLSGDSPDEIAELARVYALAGRQAEARSLLRKLAQLSERRYVAPTTFATLYAALDDNDRGFDWLERAYAERDFLLVMLRVEPMFDRLRPDPRFSALLKRMDLGIR